MTALALVPSGTIEEKSDLTPRERWEAELEAANKAMETFEKRAQIAVDRFVDERDAVVAGQKWFNIYKANTEILAAALYADIPKPIVCRRYEDYQDQVARVAALILQRSIAQDINDPEDQFDTTMDNAVQDRLIAGMACAWLRFETETEDIPTSEGGTLTNNAQSTQPHATSPEGYHDDGFEVPAAEPGQPPTPLKRIVDQNVIVDYVHWRDFRFSPCRTWEERRWVARRTYLTREQLTARFGEAKAKLTALDWSNLKGGDDPNKNDASREVFKKAQVWEIWDREAREVHWFAPGYPEKLLDSRKDFLQLQSFEPCPRPMLANITTSSTIPRPDYYMIQDQYSELNEVNARISKLVQACKVIGVYDQGADAVKNMLTANENTMIPVPNWGQFAEKQGMKGSVDWLPLEQIVAALERLNQSREVIKGQIYELTGIADIVRGDSKASETLGAQKIKAQFASIRIKKLQKETARFASDILRIKGELAAKHFEPATLIRRSGIIYTDNHEWIVDAVIMLKSELGFNWRIEVQADTMAQADYESEREDRIQFASAVTGYMAQTFPIAGQIPETKPIIMGILKWLIASFKGASDIEGMIDKQLAQLEGKPPPPPQPDPKVQAAQMKAQQDAQKLQGEMQLKTQEAQLKQAESQQKMALEQQKAELERQRMEMELAFKQQEMELDRQIHEQEMQFKQAEMGLNLQQTQAEHQLNMETSQQEAAMKMQTAMGEQELNRETQEQEMEFRNQEHEQSMQQSKAEGQQSLQQSKAAGEQKLQQAKAQSKLPKAQAAKKKGK